MDVTGKKVSVIGAGKSGVAAGELLWQKGAKVLVSEFGRIGSVPLQRLTQMPLSFEQGGHSAEVYDADFCVLSPGVPPNAEVVTIMQAKGIPLYSEIEIASWFCKARIVGITGTDGKTTTSTLVHRICEVDGLRNGYRAFSVGNIGVPFSSMVLDMNIGDVAVVELSSYQLERSPTFRPDVAVITNITPDHLDRYSGDLYRYAAAKFRIYANQGAEETLVYNEDDPLLKEHFFEGTERFPFRILPFGMDPVVGATSDSPFVFLDGDSLSVHTADGVDRVIKTSEFLKNSFRGRHNIANVLAAIAVARALGIGNDVVRLVLREFRGVEHRQEYVMTINGIDWINDSKATNINAMRQALEALPGTAVLIAGGRDKGNDYASITGLVQKKVSLLIALGESRGKITAAFKGLVPVEAVESLEDAVLFAHNAVRPGQAVLFSPGCASFDMFNNFEDRGMQFKQCVHQLPQW